MTFVFAIVLIFTFLVFFVSTYQPEYVYIVPLCSVPLLIRAFFDAKLGLFIHLLILLIVGFIVPNNYEFVIINLIAGISEGSTQACNKALTPCNLHLSATFSLSSLKLEKTIWQ